MRKPSLRCIQDKIASAFYAHGLFCASYPVPIICAVIFVAIILCSPLANLPLPGNVPLQFTTALDDYEIPPATTIKNNKQPVMDEDSKIPRWYGGPPLAYVQQITMKSLVSPWDAKQLIQTDAFRAPLSTAFDIMDKINQFKFNKGDSSISVADICYHISEPIKMKSLLPQYNCLVVSPSNIWGQNRQRFVDDGELIKTIFKNYRETLETSSIQDTLFGMPMKDTGVKKYYLRNRQRMITYSITLLLKDFDKEFISALSSYLQRSFPETLTKNVTEESELVHLYFKDVNYFVEYTPLLVTYVVLFLYLYFSVSKIEMVKSKWGLALSALATVVASLLISVALCTMFGLTPSLNGSEIFPYLVVIIGLENVLVVTKSVVSTPVHLDVKMRVAQGLSKEGWYIFKNLVTELFILLVGFFTFVPAIQEFCAFGVVGLLSDFFLQMFFFTTVLSVDIRRMEKSRKHQLSDLNLTSVQKSLHKQGEIALQNVTKNKEQQASKTGGVSRSRHPSNRHVRSKSVPGFAGIMQPTPSGPMMMNTNQETSNTPSSFAQLIDDTFFPDQVWKTPRRVRFMNYWARTRVVQRLVMVWLVVWIALIVYKTVLVEFLYTVPENDVDDPINFTLTAKTMLDENVKGSPVSHFANSLPYPLNQGSEDMLSDRSLLGSVVLWRELPYIQWQSLLWYYNISCLAKYLTVLPKIELLSVISPQEAYSMRHSNEEKMASHLNLAKASEFADKIIPGASPHGDLYLTMQKLIRQPRTKTEQFLTIMLGVASAILLTYSVSMLYKCLCSRNYSKWRSSWVRHRKSRIRHSAYYKQIRESVPLLLQGHSQDVECLVTDGSMVVSACLGGQIRVWDSNLGECLMAMKRIGSPNESKESFSLDRVRNDSRENLEENVRNRLSEGLPPNKRTLSNSESKSSHHTRHRSVDLKEILPDLTPSIETDFSNLYSPPKNPHSSSSFQDSSLTPGSLESSPAGESSGAIPIPGKRTSLNASLNPPFTLSPPHSSASHSLSPAHHVPSSPVPLVSQSSLCSSSPGYDFSHVNHLYEAHQEMLTERQEYLRSRKSRRPVSQEFSRQGIGDVGLGKECASSLDIHSVCKPVLTRTSSTMEYSQESSIPSVWSLSSKHGLIVAGCSNGQLEIWDGLSGSLKGINRESKYGITSVLFFSVQSIVVARLNGMLDIFTLDARNGTSPTEILSRSFSHEFLYEPGEGGASLGGFHAGKQNLGDHVVRLILTRSTKAHQQPINMFRVWNGHIVTGSQDHTLKVFRLEDTFCLFTLHGHDGPVTALHLDKFVVGWAASGAEDGMVRLWDLGTGTCIHKLEGHSSTVTSLTCTPIYVISTGTDDRLCIWERQRGHLIHWIQMEPGYCNCVDMLTSNLMVTGGQGCIYLWDVSKGHALRAVQLGDTDHSVFVRQLSVINNSTVVCDYGSQLRIIHFPAVLEREKKGS